MTSVDDRARQFGARPENSARSVLVTLFGDSIVPLGGEVWLGDLIALMEPFGFSDRLVRTTIFRLAAEGWLEAERVGRRSRYCLTGFARSEFAAADARIYEDPVADWGGEWTLVFVDLAPLDDVQRESVVGHLRWLGFAHFAPGLYAIPGDGSARVADLESRLGLSAPFPVALARFIDHTPLIESGRLADGFDLDEVSERYQQVLGRYAGLVGDDLGRLVGRDAFLVRTMLVHDLRRATLVDPHLPAVLLPEDWPGTPARELAGSVYRAIDSAAWGWLRQETGLVAAAPIRFGSEMAVD